MDDKKTIRLTELLDEVTQDIDELVLKNPKDYSLKGMVLVWQLEKERILVRHNPQSVVKKLRRAEGFKLMRWFFAGWIMMLAVNIAIRLLVP